MGKVDLNGLYLIASSGDKAAYNSLFAEFMSEGLRIGCSFLSRKNIYTVKPDDFVDCIGEIFLFAINNFDKSRGSFSKFCRFILARRLSRFVMKTAFDGSKEIISLDTIVDDRPLIEVIEDLNLFSMSELMNSNEMHLEMSSPKKENDKIERMRRLMVNLKLWGFTKEEIMRILNITDGSYRYLLKSNGKDEGLQNLKLELK